MDYCLIKGQPISLPSLVEGRSGVSAVPQPNRLLACVQAPLDTELVSFYSGSTLAELVSFPIGGILMETGVAQADYHVMTGPGEHFALESRYVATSDSDFTEYTVYRLKGELDATTTPVAGLLASFWLAHGECPPIFSLRRLRQAKVVGQISAQAAPGWLHTDTGRFAVRPGAFIICEHDGYGVRVVDRPSMVREFSKLCRPNDHVAVDFNQPADPFIAAY